MFEKLIELAEARRPLLKSAVLLLFSLLVFGVYLLVHVTGGIKYVYSHSMYLVIIAAAVMFGVRGGLFFALLGGIALGPFMPIDTITGEQQETVNWLYRLGFFLLVGLLAGAFSTLIRNHLKQVKWQLQHNTNTGLPNRFALYDTINQNADNGRKQRLYLIFLTTLPELELRLGSGIREIMISTLVDRLHKQLPYQLHAFHPKSNHVAMLVNDAVGDEFSAVLAGINKTVSEPMIFEGIPIIPGYVCGSVDIDGKVNDTEEYLRKAEVCVIQARSRHILHLHYSPGLEQISKYNVETLGLLKVALDNNALDLHYQPKYDLESHRITGMEALVRWTDPVRGVIGPASFIPIVEKSQLIKPLTCWVMDKALRDLAGLGKRNFAMDRVAINISVSNLLDPGFINDVESLLSQHEIEPGQIEFEVTETSLMVDFGFCSRQIKALSDMGISIVLDDFGTGYSSLQYLDRLPFSIIKLDQVFIKDLNDHASKQHIVDATIKIAHNLGSSIVAEGIEDHATEDMLRSMHCDSGQGYFFSRPLDLDSLELFLNDRAA